MSDVYGIAREYGRALFMLTEEVGSTEQVREDARCITELLSSNPEYSKMLDTPALSPDERLALVDEAFASLDGHLVNLVKILAKRRMAYAVPRTLLAFEEEYMQSRGIVKAEVITAVALSGEQESRLAKKLGRITGKQIIIENKVDPSILGGMKLRYMGIQRDGSVKASLESFAAALGETVIQ